jgi:arsenate reductase
MKRKILFVCIHNSARSQMAEAFVHQLCGDCFEAYSAGLEPGRLNPVVVEVMRELGLDLSANRTKSCEDLLRLGLQFDYVATVCDEASAERCPVFPGGGRRLHWGFPDPSSFQGDPAAKLAFTRGVRDQIKARIEAWCHETCPPAGRV